MNNRKSIIFILIGLVLILFSLVIYLLTERNQKVEFYAKVKESYSSSSIVEPLHNDKIYKDYPVLQITVGDLEEGDIIKVSANKNFLKSYPPIAVVDDYEYISSKTNTPITTTTTTSTTTKANINKQVDTTTTTTTKTTTRTTTITKAAINNESKDNIVLSLLQSKINSIETNKENKSFGSTAKEYFINAVDFIFYNKDIKGVYFKDLTNKAKLKTIALVMKLDNLIEKYYPEYKENASSSYQNIRSKLIELYLDKTAEYCAKNDDVCSQAKQDFQELKTNYGITWEFIKGLGNKGLSKLKEWYEVYSGK